MKMNNLKILGATGLIFLMISNACFPLAVSSDGDTAVASNTAFTKGIPWQPFKPLKRVTLVGFDKESYNDDYAYLASIPACVFSNGETMFSSPLLFFQPENTYPSDDKYRFLNDYPGTHYLMEDWMGYCDGRLDKLTMINVPESDLESEWKARNFTSIEGNDPFDVASKIALNEWSYSDDAVVAVIEKNYEKPQDTKITGIIGGEISGEVGTDSLTVKRPYAPAPEYEYFTIGNEYKYVKAELWYPCFVTLKKVINAIPSIGGPGATIPYVDPDIQIYCKYGCDWLQTAAASDLTMTGGPYEHCFSYVYNPGDWRVSITNMPTKGGVDDAIHYGPFGNGKIVRYGDFKDALKNALFGVTSFNVDITKYPGVEVNIPDLPPYGCRDATFTLTWGSKDTTLGLTIIGPSGEELDSVMEEGVGTQEIHFNRLGECLKGEHYKAVVYALNDISTPTGFTVEYTWQQNITQKEGDLTASACEGAILGSTINAPMFYTTPDMVPTCTKDALYKLGVKNIHIIDLGGHLSEEAKDELSNIAEIEEHYTEYKSIYDAITTKTGSNDIIFSTIDPWSYWYYIDKAGKLKPAGEFEKAFYFGPAAYAAAHHGSPLLLVDNHPELSGAVTWHVDFWQKHASGLQLPAIAPMFLTGSKVQDFLREYGFDKEGPESILTVAGQYDIGPTWSRAFVGVGNSGAIIGTPVDVTNHISRCIFYPGLIFQNPALKEKVKLETGSESTRAFGSLKNPIQGGLLQRLWPGKTEGLSNLIITKPSQIEEFEYPVLHTYGCYGYRFNERGSKYWDCTYQTRTGHTPGVDISGEEIDQGIREKFEGKSGCFMPDVSNTDVCPFYAEKAGYSNVFSTDFDITMDNLNQGVISWYMILHGDSGHGGRLAWWQPLSKTLSSAGGVSPNLANAINKIAGVPLGLNPYEKNPWRGYEMLWGSTAEPDSAVLNSKIGLLHGWINPLRDPLNRGILKIGLDIVPSHTAGYYDGVIGPYGITAMLTMYMYSHDATEVDDKLENLHSMDFHAGSCLIGCNYLQIVFMRHGSVLQECDPWPTSYGGFYSHEKIPREYALGKTAGETYTQGLDEVGIKYLFEKNEDRVWWWDNAENVVLFTDPDMRIFTPGTEYSDANYWEQDDVQPIRYDEELDINGHMPFGATDYPHEKEPLIFLQQYFVLIIAIAVIVILVIVAVCLPGKNK